MELGTAIVGIIVALLCIVPFVIINRQKKKREGELIQALFSLAAEENCKIKEYDVWNHSSIGIDDNNRFLLYTRKLKDNFETQIIDLMEIQKSSVSNIKRSVKTDDSLYEIIERVELVFSLQYKNRAEVVLEFYNANYDKPTITVELELVNKWSKLINSSIPSSVKQSL